MHDDDLCDDLNTSKNTHVEGNGLKDSFANEFMVKRKGYLIGYYASMILRYSS